RRQAKAQRIFGLEDRPCCHRSIHLDMADPRCGSRSRPRVSVADSATIQQWKAHSAAAKTGLPRAIAFLKPCSRFAQAWALEPTRQAHKQAPPPRTSREVRICARPRTRT